ncbi:MAG: RluA family pseudouridine synthase, partial [Acidobacteriota bacterium]|nr:RluA family pseudouridine synthase [Acidobacteriota bacterium]
MESNETDETSAFILHPSSLDLGKRLDAFLAENIEDWSRARLQRLIEGGDVLVNQKDAKPSYKLREGDEIEGELTAPIVETMKAENIPLDVIYEDEHLIVINKQAGLIVHAGVGVRNGTLVNALMYHFQNLSQLGGKSRAGIVHRLDKNTSGLIVVAKDEATHEALSNQFQMRQVYKSYVALVHGAIRRESGKIEEKIGRDKWNRMKMSVAKNGRNALSLWTVRQRFEKFTLLDVEIKTGRTHQIRVHLAFLNHPIVGDETYNEGRDKTVSDVKVRQAIQNLNRFFLHAEKLSFTHPKTKEKMDF